MLTPFSAALVLLGLTNRAAAHLLGVSEDTANSWSVGRRRVPDGVWARLTENANPGYVEQRWQTLVDARGKLSAV